MSFGEILVVCVVGILVLDLKDIKSLIVNVIKIKNWLTDLKNQILDPLKLEIDSFKDQFLDEQDEINFYMEKISNMNHLYQGEYSLDQIKQYYYKLLKDQ